MAQQENDTTHDDSTVTIDLAGRTLASVVMEAERAALCAAMNECDGKRTKAAELLGLSYDTFRKRLAAYNVRTVYQ